MISLRKKKMISLIGTCFGKFGNADIKELIISILRNPETFFSNGSSTCNVSHLAGRYYVSFT